MCRQRWLRIKCAFTHTSCKVLEEQQLPLLCSVRQSCPAQDVLLPTSQVWLQISSWCCKCWLFRQLFWEICAACIIPESLGRSLRSTAPCKREKLNRGSWAIAHDEMLHSGGAELACTVLHCREKQSCSKKLLSLTVDANSTRLLHCEALLKN